MQIEVIASVNEARADKFTHRTAIVIDVLRATSTIVAALDAGAAGVIPVETVLEARALHREGQLLAGERFGRKIPGFEFGNSPEEFGPGAAAGKRIVLTTTNGTRAVQKAMRADHLLAGSLLNATACAETAVLLKRDIVLLCSGSHDEFALEDGLCAGLFISRIRSICPSGIVADDLGIALQGLYDSAAERIGELLFSGASGKRLVKLGYGRDVEYCGRVDLSRTVPRLSGDMMVAG
ncbi:2-phosphosulfolactate phosphatase [Paenibacillus humicola]|uniref:2-phosphosulfolactate phosphatase n=1 Tax=Paenibacillus humicola TaxID=3110540 RepID=UPI00237B3AB6|nr:2-phosphosulfolactate phosphatase [Paenibacillus humicola]